MAGASDRGAIQLDTSVPDHVPPELVRTYNRRPGPAKDWREPYAETRELLTGDYPPVFYLRNPMFPGRGGSWAITRADLIREAYQTPEVFSSEGIGGFQFLAGETWQMLPLSVDAPLHLQYRSMLVGAFSPKAMAALEGQVRDTANALIDAVYDKGECEFVRSFARPFPVTIFMKLMGFPLEMYDQFMIWEKHILSAANMPMEERAKGIAESIAWLRSFIELRETDPKDDVTSLIVKAQVDGRPITDDEKIGTVFMLFVGGLDTVAASLSQWFAWLAGHPDRRQELVDHPELIPAAVEELLRTHPVVDSPRHVTRDITFHGVSMKAGDSVVLMNQAGNFDPAEFSDPREVEFARAENRHLTMAAGPHRCLGSHLARRELRIAIETWLRRAPDFRIKDGVTPDVRPGLGAMFELPLVWDVRR